MRFVDAPIGATFELVRPIEGNDWTARWMKISDRERPWANSIWVNLDLRKWIEWHRQHRVMRISSPIGKDCRIESDSEIIIVGQAWLAKENP